MFFRITPLIFYSTVILLYNNNKGFLFYSILKRQYNIPKPFCWCSSINDTVTILNAISILLPNFPHFLSLLLTLLCPVINTLQPSLSPALMYLSQ